MTDNTQPEAMGLADWLEAVGGGPSAKRCAALLREQHTRIAELESELEAVGAGGVSGPLMGQPQAMPDLSALTERGAKAWAGVDAQALRDGTHQQAAPKAAPGELHDHQILAITTAYEQGVGKGRQAHESGKEIANPYDTGYRCDLAWQYGYKEGKEQAERIAKAAPQQEAQEPVAWLNPWRADKVTTDYDAYGERGIPLYTAPQPAPAPLSDDVVQKTWALLDELEKLRGADRYDED